MYRQQLWTMRQYAGYASAKESNFVNYYPLVARPQNVRFTWMLSNKSIPFGKGYSRRNGRCLALRRATVTQCWYRLSYIGPKQPYSLPHSP